MTKFSQTLLNSTYRCKKLKLEQNLKSFYVLLDLMTTVSGCEINDEFKLFGGVCNILAFELLFLSFVGPCQSFVHVKSTINSSSYCNQSPANGF